MKYPINGKSTNIGGRFYVTQYGDNIHSIAQRYNTTVEELLAYNNHLGNADISPEMPDSFGGPSVFPGEMLFIPTATAKTNRNRRTRKR